MGISEKVRYNFVRQTETGQKIKEAWLNCYDKRSLKMRKQEMVKQETKNRITKAFWELYKTTNIEKITVKRITDACGIYRTTFYLHFADVYAILEQIEDELLGEMKGFSSEIVRTAQEKEDLMLRVCASFEKNHEYLNVLLSRKGDQKFADQYKREMTSLLCALHRVEMSTLKGEAKDIAVKSFSAMIDLLLTLGDAPQQVSFDKILLIMDGYLKNGIINTLRELYGN